MPTEYQTPNTPATSPMHEINTTNSNTSDAPETKSVPAAKFDEVHVSEVAGDNGSDTKPVVPAESNETHLSEPTKDTASLNNVKTIAVPTQTASTKLPRKNRTPAQKALDDALEAHRKAHEKTLAAVEVARANLQESEHQRKFAAGVKMMHTLLLKSSASTRDGVLTMLVGLADDVGQEVLHAYLEALNSASAKIKSSTSTTVTKAAEI